MESQKNKLFSKEALEFSPDEKDVFIKIDGKGQQRLIFSEPVPLTEEEEKKLTELRAFITEKNHSLPEGYDDASRLILRFFQGAAWDKEKTVQWVKAHHEFMKPHKGLALEDVSFYLSQGFVYGFKRDLRHRPLIFINVERLVKANLELEDLIRVCVYFLDYVADNALLPAKIENWFVIIDCKNVGIT